MRLVGSRHKDKSGGYYIQDATRGFWGDKLEGEEVLQEMGLRIDKLPFSMAFYLKKRKAQWKDSEGRLVCISFCVTQQRIEFYASYNGKKKSTALWREWETYEDKDEILRLESEAIGNMSMLCLYEKMFATK